MAQFVTNIELQNFDETIYRLLHRKQEKESMKNEFHSSEIVAYVAGKKAFILKDSFTLQDVNQAVFTASAKSGKSYSFFVTAYKAAS